MKVIIIPSDLSSIQFDPFVFEGSPALLPMYAQLDTLARAIDKCFDDETKMPLHLKFENLNTAASVYIHEIVCHELLSRKIISRPLPFVDLELDETILTPNEVLNDIQLSFEAIIF